jgi:BlaI family penicillinase repressor
MDIRLSEAELEVMEVLWGASEPLGATDVAAVIGEERNWTLATVKTLLSRLFNKRAIEPARDGRRFLYSPRIGRGEYVGAESRRFVDRMFGGRLSPLIAQLAAGEALDDADIAEIEALLKQLKS